MIHKVLFVGHHVHWLDIGSIHMVGLHAHNICRGAHHNILWLHLGSDTSPLDVRLHVKNVGSHVGSAQSVSSLGASKVTTEICRLGLERICLKNVTKLVLDIKWTLII